jgi:spore coat protein U-like protein
MSMTAELGILNGAAFIGEPASAVTSISESVQYKRGEDLRYTTRGGGLVGSDAVNRTGGDASQSCTMYGRIPAQTTPALGSYLDAMTVTVTY